MRLLQFEHRIWRQNHIRARKYFLWIWWAGWFGCSSEADMDNSNMDQYQGLRLAMNEYPFWRFCVDYHRPYTWGEQLTYNEIEYMSELWQRCVMQRGLHLQQILEKK